MVPLSLLGIRGDERVLYIVRTSNVFFWNMDYQIETGPSIYFNTNWAPDKGTTAKEGGEIRGVKRPGQTVYPRSTTSYSHQASSIGLGSTSMPRPNV